jgi:hypothetical protein
MGTTDVPGAGCYDQILVLKTEHVRPEGSLSGQLSRPGKATTPTTDYNLSPSRAPCPKNATNTPYFDTRYPWNFRISVTRSLQRWPGVHAAVPR